MNAIWSLPQFPPESERTTEVATRAARAGFDDETRTIVGKTLAQGVLNGRVRPAAVRKAMARGMSAVLSLIAKNAVLPQTPVVPAKALKAVEVKAGKGLPEAVLTGCLTWLVALHDAGAMDDATVGRLASGRDVLALVEGLATAWSKFVDDTILASGIEGPVDAASIYYVAPAPLQRAMSALRADPTGCDDDFSDYLTSGDGIGDGVVMYVSDYSFFSRPDHPISDPEFFAAFTGAWDSIACGSANFTLLDTRSTDDSILGSQGEALEDMLRRATWVNGEPVVSADVLRDYEDEFGSWQEGNEQPKLMDMLKYRRAAALIKAIKPGTPRMEKWLHDNAGTRKVALVEALLCLSSVASKRKKVAHKDSHVAYGQGAAFLTCLIPAGTGMDELYDDNLQGMYEETSCMALWPKSQNPSVLLSLASEAIIGAAVASVAASHLMEFHRAQPR